MKKGDQGTQENITSLYFMPFFLQGVRVNSFECDISKNDT